VAQQLASNGFDRVKIILGGWNAWHSAGYPTEAQAAPAPVQP
jgi:3-mercaptopyruvate sulfurtransferase SseA